MTFREVHLTLGGLRAACEYAANPHHSNHEGIGIAGPRCINCSSVQDFLGRVETAYERYQVSRRPARGPLPLPGSEMIIASKDHANLRETESASITECVTKLNSEYPILIWDHTSEGRRRRDTHLIIGDFSIHERPSFRRSQFGNSNKNYTYYVQRVIEDVIRKINTERRESDEEPLEFWSDSVLARKIERGWVPLALQLFFTGKAVTRANLFELLRSLGHDVDESRSTRDYVSIRCKGAGRSIRIAISELLTDVARPCVPSIQYRSRSGRLPLHLRRAAQVLATWTARTEKISTARRALAR